MSLLKDLSIADLPLIRAKLSERRLVDFMRFTWPAVEPVQPFVRGWVLDAICDHLEAVADGDIMRLIINVPPGFAKSLTTNVFFPAWLWGPRKRPDLRFMSVSYSSQLTERDNLRLCQLVGSDVYRQFWGDVFTANESMVKVSNDKTGWKLATSVGGVGTGERADFVLVDDPNSVKQAESKVVRDSTNQWVMEVMPTRLNNPATSSIVIIQQRTHDEDVTGALLTAELGYEHLVIPMEWDGRRYTTSIGWTDPREIIDVEPTREDREWFTVKGELAFPERFPVWVVERDKKALGRYASEGQLQQSPMPRGGGIIQRDWWQQWGPDDPKGLRFPPFEVVIGSYDGALGVKEQNDPSALAVLGTFRDPVQGVPRVMLARCWAKRLPINEAVVEIDATCRRYRVSILLIENKASGHPVFQELHRLFRDKPYSVVLVDPGSRDKVARAMSVVPLFEDEMVWCPNTEWAVAAKDEVSMFPRGAHDDQVDAIVNGLLWMRENGLLQRTVEFVEEEREMAEDDRPLAPLYRA